MLNALKRFLPVRMALKAGPLTLFEATFFDMDDDEAEIDQEHVVLSGFQTGFAPPERCDEVNPRLDPLEDDDATSRKGHNRPQGHFTRR